MEKQVGCKDYHYIVKPIEVGGRGYVIAPAY